MTGPQKAGITGNRDRTGPPDGQRAEAGGKRQRQDGGDVIRRSLQEKISELVPAGQIRWQEPMDRHCSFRTGGQADALVYVRTEEEMASLLTLLRGEEEAFFVLGKGTNLLIGDGGYRGVIVTAVGGSPAGGPPAGSKRAGVLTAGDSLQGESGDDPSAGLPLDLVTVEGSRVRAGAGATLKAAAVAAMEHGLSGLEFAAGIPGTVGGGLVMNAGAYGGEMKQVVESVRLLMPDGSIRTWSGSEMKFGYRTSLLRHLPATALRAEFALTPGDPEAIRAKIADLGAQRRAKQPLEYPSAGSTFKRPEGYFAGKLIMDAGLAGYSVGGAQVSEKHCGFVINRGGATSAQIRTLIGDVQKKVFEDAGVRLEPEVIFLGEF